MHQHWSVREHRLPWPPLATVKVTSLQSGWKWRWWVCVCPAKGPTRVQSDPDRVAFKMAQKIRQFDSLGLAQSATEWKQKGLVDPHDPVNQVHYRSCSRSLFYQYNEKWNSQSSGDHFRRARIETINKLNWKTRKKSEKRVIKVIESKVSEKGLKCCLNDFSRSTGLRQGATGEQSSATNRHRPPSPSAATIWFGSNQGKMAEPTVANRSFANAKVIECRTIRRPKLLTVKPIESGLFF